MSDGLVALQAVPVAVADIAVGGLLARHVSPAIGLALVAVGVLVLCTAVYRTVRRSDTAESTTRHPV